ncbi:SbtR family transcriptional regulator [Kribbella pratensis]|uniref:SbtR family transcriptional regulator n=1 Tax=Kribbella pratensis TaxID=2512112 RepID=UPI00192E1130|nr:hypothetical protein [Kribbella pratensis]
MRRNALSPIARQAITEQTYGPVVAAITQLLDAGKKDGSIRTDADAGDFLQLTGALWRTPSEPHVPVTSHAHPHLDGLRPQPHQ